MKRLFFLSVLFFCSYVLPANHEHKISDQKLLNKFFVLSGAMGECHFCDMQFLSKDKKHALCVLGCACDEDVRGYFNKNFIKSLKSSDFTQNYKEIRLSIGEVISRLFSECKMKKDDQNRTLFAVALRIIYLGPEAMLSLWGSRPKADCCTHVVVADTRPYMFKSLRFETDEPAFKELGVDLVKRYAQENDLKGFLTSIIKKNPEHKLGVAVNYQAWKKYSESSKMCILQ